MSIEQASQESREASRTLVFLGGINYDQTRNQETGTKIMELAGYDAVITIDDESPNPKRDDTVIFEYPNGHMQELPSKLAMKQLDDNAVQRYSKLHERRARALIAQIEQSGGKPVDAVFQSVDTSTGILAMRERPDLFRKVLLVDPSSIIKHPRRRTFFRELFRQGDFRTLTETPHAVSGEHTTSKLSPLERMRRMRKTARFGNMWATYLSTQSKMLHEIAHMQDAPYVSVLASRLDHAYSPAKIISSLVDTDDIAELFISESRHAISKSSDKLAQIVTLLKEDVLNVNPTRLATNVHFANAVPQAYRQQIKQLLNELSHK